MKYQSRLDDDEWEDSDPTPNIKAALAAMSADFSILDVQVSAFGQHRTYTWRIKPRDKQLFHDINKITSNHSRTEMIYGLLEDRGLV